MVKNEKKANDEEHGTAHVLKRILSIAETLGDTLGDKIGNTLSDVLGSAMKQLSDGLYKIEKNILLIFFTAMLFISGVLFMAIALILIIPQYFDINLGWSLFMVGIVMIAMSWIVKYRIGIEKRV